MFCAKRVSRIDATPYFNPRAPCEPLPCVNELPSSSYHVPTTTRHFDRFRLISIAFAFALTACGGTDAVVGAPVKSSPHIDESAPVTGIPNTSASAAPSAPAPINFETYEGSGEVVHPDVVSFAKPWNGHRLWTTLTPYPHSEIAFENPSIFNGDDGHDWTIPVGATNPLARTDRGHLSDPDMVFDEASGTLRMYYREVELRPAKKGAAGHIADHLWMASSTDGVRWSAPTAVVSDTGHYVVSPSIVHMPSGEWHMWAVDAGVDGCSAKATRVIERTSSDGLLWSESSVSGLTQPGFVPWHLDVQYVAARREYWALTAAYPRSRGCMATRLFLATSRDGRTWTTYPSPVLSPSDYPAFSSAVYRSTFALAAPDTVSFWFSGARMVKPGKKKSPPVFAWSAATARMPVDELFRRVLTKRQSSPGSSPPTGGPVLTGSVP